MARKLNTTGTTGVLAPMGFVLILALAPSAQALPCPNEAQHSTILPDCRAYEMVSPLDKNGSNIGASTHFTSRAAVDGQRVSFTSNSGFGDTVGSEHDGFTSYVATREAGGWSSHSITPLSPPNEMEETDDGATKFELAFTGTLAQAIYLGGGLPGADPGTGLGNLYREETGSRALETVTLNNGSCKVAFCSRAEDLFSLINGVVGYSSDAGVIAFQSKLTLTPGALSVNMKLYEWDHGVLRLGGILPGEKVPAGGSMAIVGKEPIENQGSVSSDGSRVLFASPAVGSSAPQLYMRKNGTSTVWLSRSWTSSPSAEPAGVHFQAASADDTRVLFTSETRLLNSDTGEGSTGIYLYTDTSENAESEEKLSLIARVNGEGQATVAGMSDDATHIYFFNSMPTSSMPRGGEYLWDNGTLHFVASVKKAIDPHEHVSLPPGTAVRVSDDGSRLAFLWAPDLEEEPELAKPGPQQDNSGGRIGMYVYDEGSEKLTCASCPPDGAPMTSSVTVASSVNGVSVVGTGGLPFPQRYMSSDGRYVFFTTEQSLLAADTNGDLADVYEYDVGTGELKLLSSGTGESGSWFEDASANGSDVFLLTAQKMTGWDTDTLTDLYDARVNGGFPEPPPPPVPCDGDACQGVPSAVPSFYTASGFSGLGNQHTGATVAVKKKATSKANRRVKGRHKKHAKKSRTAGSLVGIRPIVPDAEGSRGNHAQQTFANIQSTGRGDRGVCPPMRCVCLRRVGSTSAQAVSGAAQLRFAGPASTGYGGGHQFWGHGDERSAHVHRHRGRRTRSDDDRTGLQRSFEILLDR